jgi:hypothetical protein
MSGCFCFRLVQIVKTGVSFSTKKLCDLVKEVGNKSCVGLHEDVEKLIDN